MTAIEAKAADRFPRRVLLVEINEDGTVGGSHRCLFEIVSHLDRSAWTPVSVFYESNRVAKQIGDAGLPVVAWDDVRARERKGAALRLPRPFRTAVGTLGAILRRVALIRTEGIDLVHLNNTTCIGFDDWLPAARLAGVPISAHARGPYVAPNSRLGQRLANGFDAVIAISDSIRSDFLAHGTPAERLHLVYDGIDVKRWAGPAARGPAETRAEFGVRPDEIVLILVGLIRSWKGQDVAVNALSLIEPALRDKVRLWIVGQAPESDRAYADGLHDLVQRRSLADKVQFLGFRSDVRELMGAADIVLHASTVPEPFGLVVIEGMALAKPVVASRLGGPSEVIRSGDGMLFDPRSPAELARCVTSLALDPELRNAVGQRAVRRAADFDIERNVAGVTSIWSSLLASRKTRS